MNKLFPPLQYLNTPNAMTSLAIVCALLSLVWQINGQNKLVALFFWLAIVLDYMDGIVARKLNQTSRFGLYLDSLADAVNFCTVPAILSWVLGMRNIHEIAILLLFVLAGIWRLTYYNVHGLENEAEAPGFTGLPTTLSACYFLIIYCLNQHALIGFLDIAPAFIATMSVLMLSGLRIRKNGPVVPITGVMTTIAVAILIIN